MTKKVLAVVGLGYVGLPVAVLAKKKGWAVIGVDVDEEKIDKINAGVCPLKDDTLAKELAANPISATTDPARVKEAAVIIVAVPTPIHANKDPNLEPLKAALASIRPYLTAGQLLSIESTINPGVMNEIVLPLLHGRSDLVLDADSEQDALYVVHCPERINPGDSRWTVETIPRVIGGYTAAGTRAGQEFYASILDSEVRPMASVTEAEAVKIFENTFRDVNIAFVNEMAKSFDRLDINITNVIAGAATKPFAFLAHYPGNGVGGHCISVDPYYMIERARQVGFDHEFLKLARRINDSMPAYTLQLMDHGWRRVNQDPAKKPVVALLGMTYKKNIDDVRESPALAIRQLLADNKISTKVFDPFVPRLSTVDSLEQALVDADVVILASDHTSIVEQLTPEYLQKAGVKLIIDGRNALDQGAFGKSDILYYGVGRSDLTKK